MLKDAVIRQSDRQCINPILIGFLEEQLKFDSGIFSGYDALGDVLFISVNNADGSKFEPTGI